MKRIVILLAFVLAWVLMTPAALIALRYVRDPKKRRWLKIAAVVGTIPYILGFYARFIEPKTLIVQHAEIISPAWRADPIRIGVISDTHVGGPHVTAARIEKIVAQMNAEKPDIVVLLGDYTNGRKPVVERSPAELREEEAGIAAFAKFKAPKGVYAAMGNNDLLYDEKVERARLEKAGAKVLQNEAASIPGMPASVIGFDLHNMRRVDVPGTLAKVPAGNSVIAIMHYPDTFWIVPDSIALSLAGHSHCGQIGLPLAKYFIHPSGASFHFRCHAYDTEGRKSYVSGGIGTSVLPMRLFAPPEISIVTLRGK